VAGHRFEQTGEHGQKAGQTSRCGHGGSSGIGRAACLGLGAAGACVAVVGRDAVRTLQTADEAVVLAGPDKVLSLQGDVRRGGVFLSNRAVLPMMIAQRRGQIVNISSTYGRQGRALDSAYCASKFGIVGLSEALAEEVRPYRVKVHLLFPDAIETHLWIRTGPCRIHRMPCRSSGLPD
jgi:NAD(P)-dependent dehydrogenase (short-subunit alcohol dehydrogenase family)